MYEGFPTQTDVDAAKRKEAEREALRGMTATERLKYIHGNKGDKTQVVVNETLIPSGLTECAEYKEEMSRHKDQLAVLQEVAPGRVTERLTEIYRNKKNLQDLVKRFGYGELK